MHLLEHEHIGVLTNLKGKVNIGIYCQVKLH